MTRVLVVVEPAAERRRIRDLILGADVVVAEGGPSDLRRRIMRGDLDVLVVDRSLLPRPASILIDPLRALPEPPEIIVLSSRLDPGEHAELLAAGLPGVVQRDLDDRLLQRALRGMIERRREDSNLRLQAERPEERFSLEDFVSRSPAMCVFLDLARRVARSDSSVLLLGETGVGKERLARALHAEGPRPSGPFIAVNCSALPETLLESELFGHEQGAFTGATRSKRGYFELAHGGTLFLDEIGETPTHLQVKLLRALDEKKIQRVGGEEPIGVDVRVMAATNRDLDADMREHRFRPDLFFRLAVVTLTIPPLRERREDIPTLVESYLVHFTTQARRHISAIHGEAMDVLVRYHWPGNVRELVNAVERAVLLCSGETIVIDDLPVRIVKAVLGGEALPVPGGAPELDALVELPLAEARRTVVSDFEKRYLSKLLGKTGGRVYETAQRAGVNERSLYGLMRRHGLRKERFKPQRRPRKRSRPSPESA